MSARSLKIGDKLTVRTPVRAYSAAASHLVEYRDRQLLPGVAAAVFSIPACVRSVKCSCGKRHQTFFAAEFTHDDGVEDRAAVMACNVAEVIR